MRAQTLQAQINFLQKADGLSLSDRVRSSVLREGFRLEPPLLHFKRRWFRLSSPGQGFPAMYVLPGAGPGVDWDRLHLSGGQEKAR